MQRNGLQFGKKMTPLTTVAAQDYLTLSTSATDFDVLIGLWRADTQVPVPFPPEPIWEQSQAPDALTMANISYADDKIKFKGTPASALTLNLWYYPTVGAESMTVGSTLPWGGRVDDIIMEYAANRLKNIDEMDLTFDTQLMTDMETQILQAYSVNSAVYSETTGWTGNI